MISDSEIFDLVSCLPYASFKDASSGKYILVSADLATRCRFEAPDDMVGLTVDDLGFSQTQLGKAFEEATKKMDGVVRLKRQVVKLSHVGMRFPDSKLIYQTISKLPIVGDRNLLGIISIGEDLTGTLSHYELYHLYIKLCGSREVAIKKLLQHFEIDTWFFTLPSEAELLVLLERSSGSLVKEISAARGVSDRTVHAQINSLRSRLKGNVLSLVMEKLRAHHKPSAHDMR